MRFGCRLTVIAAAAVAACSGDGAAPSASELGSTTSVSAASSASASIAAPTPATSSVSPYPADPRPLFTLTESGGLPPLFVRPADLADVYVYPDGVVVGVAYDWNIEELVQTREHVTDRYLSGLVALADAAGLSGGGEQSQLPAPYRIEDGGRSRFSARDRDMVTTRWVDQIDSESVGDDEARLRFGALYDELARFERDRRPMVPVERWVITSEPATTSTWAVEGSWAMMPENLTWTELGTGVKCVVVEVPHWTVTADEPLMILNGGRLMSRRPLVRNETDCADVAAWRSTLGLDRADDLPDFAPIRDGG
jgi:hypothetical protein